MVLVIVSCVFVLHWPLDDEAFELLEFFVVLFFEQMIGILVEYFLLLVLLCVQIVLSEQEIFVESCRVLMYS